jgi:hypothetical protein
MSWWRWDEVLLLGKPPEDGWESIMVIFITYIPLIVSNNLQAGNWLK